MVKESSLIWETKYFKRLVDGSTECNLCKENRCHQCKKTQDPCKLQGQHASNVKKHLKTCHNSEHNEFQKYEESKRLPIPTPGIL